MRNLTLFFSLMITSGWLHADHNPAQHVFVALGLTHQTASAEFQNSSTLSSPLSLMDTQPSAPGTTFMLGSQFQNFRLYGTTTYTRFDAFDVQSLLGGVDYWHRINPTLAAFIGASGGLAIQRWREDPLPHWSQDNQGSFTFGLQGGVDIRLYKTLYLEAGLRLYGFRMRESAQIIENQGGVAVHQGSISYTLKRLTHPYLALSYHFD